MVSVELRDAESDDIAGILRITERSWNAAYSDILSQETIDQTMVELHESDVTRRLIKREDVAYFVAERSDDIVGYISGVPSDEENAALLETLYVDPDYWNEGIGTVLLRTFEEFCRQRGAEWIQFSVLDENEIGLTLYRKHGYAKIDEGTQTGSANRSLSACSVAKSSDSVIISTGQCAYLPNAPSSVRW